MIISSQLSKPKTIIDVIGPLRVVIMETSKDLSQWLTSSALSGENQSYIEDLYEDYLKDPNSVEESWQVIFQSFPQATLPEKPHSPIRDHFKALAKQKNTSPVVITNSTNSTKLVNLLNWVDYYRKNGHLKAKLDPLQLWQRAEDPALDYHFYGLTEADLNESFPLNGIAYNQEKMTLGQLEQALAKTYSGTLALEFMHLGNKEAQQWLQQKMENLLQPNLFSQAEKLQFLQELTAADGLERYLGAKFPGAKRFSLEGSDAFIMMIKEMIRHSSQFGVKEIVFGMAHRGRLNMLVNVLGKTPAELCDEFSGQAHLSGNQGSGDVKYHQGRSADFNTDQGLVHLALAYNPSHLEIVSPVVQGSVRARQDRLADSTHSQVLPITVHGDSAIAGQGIVQETLNMSKARGYEVGGTIRIAINNQIGFTTSNLADTRSTEYCTDVAKMIGAPVIHVNGDDAEAVAYAARMAVEYRNKFKGDIFIDLVSYRRHGHNEADEPSMTQPLMYKTIKKHPTPAKIYAEKLEQQGVIDNNYFRQLSNQYRDQLDQGDCVMTEWQAPSTEMQQWEEKYLTQEWTDYTSTENPEIFKQLAQKVCQYPDTHPLHSRVKKVYADRQLMADGEKLFDWGMGETLAYATLLNKGINIRLSGEDAGRATFSHRHSVLHNQNDDSCYIPLQHLEPEQGHFEVWDSVLSEAGVLAFEYGYATTMPKSLTIWEAQFGDFANGAQVVIDQFISSGEQKWGRMCGLVMLLPHGFEGQGPEHSSARIERYLQLCAQQNMQVCIPTTPAQIYHLLRRQILRNTRRPLIVATPKSLLRHPLAVSSMEDLIYGHYQNVIDEIDDINPSKVRKVIFCSGKVYYDLLEKRRANQQQDIAIIRIEQLYPYPAEEVKEIVAKYAQVTDFVWCQEEPKNQGAWYCCQDSLRASLANNATLNYVGRAASAAPAVGFASLHNEQQRQLVEEALA